MTIDNVVRLILFLPLAAILLSIVRVSYSFYLFKKTGLDKIDRMSGVGFEKYLTTLFSWLGYKVTHIGSLGDFGGDLIIEKEGVKILVQAKRSNNSVRINAVQEALAAKEYYRCNRAMVVTNNYFYKRASLLGEATRVELWSRKELTKAILGTG